MSYEVRCDNCKKLGARESGTYVPKDWLWFEMRSSDGSEHIVTMCSVGCAHGVWRPGPGGKPKDVRCTHLSDKAREWVEGWREVAAAEGYTLNEVYVNFENGILDLFNVPDEMRASAAQKLKVDSATPEGKRRVRELIRSMKRMLIESAIYGCKHAH